MHIGHTKGAGLEQPMIDLGDSKDGAISPDGRIMGCYLHGLFAADDYRAAFLDRIRSGRTIRSAYDIQVENTLDELAVHLEKHVAIDALLKIARQGM